MAGKDNTTGTTETELVYDYISEMAAQLAELAAGAGNPDLSHQLRQAAKCALEPLNNHQART